MARPPSKSRVAAYRPLPCRLLRSVRRIIFVPYASFVFLAAPTQYVFRDQIQFIIMFSEIMFMMFVLSNMLESCMLGLILVMLYLIQNLILQLSIFPSICTIILQYISFFSPDHFSTTYTAPWVICKVLFG